MAGLEAPGALALSLGARLDACLTVNPDYTAGTKQRILSERSLPHHHRVTLPTTPASAIPASSSRSYSKNPTASNHSGFQKEQSKN